MTHMYACMQCLKKTREKPKRFPEDLPPEMRGALIEAAFRKNVMPYKRREKQFPVAKNEHPNLPKKTPSPQKTQPAVQTESSKVLSV